MLPAERGKVGEQRRRDQVAVAPCCAQGATEVDGVPQRDGGRDQGEAAGPVLLGLGRAVVQPPEAVEAHGTSQGVAAFALVQLRRGLPAKLGPLQPVQGVQGALNASDLPQRQGQPVLPRVGAEPLE